MIAQMLKITIRTNMENIYLNELKEHSQVIAQLSTLSDTVLTGITAITFIIHLRI